MSVPSASIGVDVDSLHHYYQIHGLSRSNASNAAWDIGVVRFLELFAEHGVQCTFYCVAEDLNSRLNQSRIREIVERGHEIGNHSLTHPYDLSRLDRGEMTREVGESRDQLSQVAGVDVLGFRAPGYTVNKGLVDAVFSAGHLYDTSVFPCAPYYLAKASVMGLMSLRGRRSSSVLGSPRVLMAPGNPYRMDSENPYRVGQTTRLQFPITVCGGIPMLGTAFSVLGPAVSRAAVRAACRRYRHVTMEFHAADLLSLTDDDLDPKLAVQFDLKMPVARKKNIFSAAIGALTRYARVNRLDRTAQSTLE